MVQLMQDVAGGSAEVVPLVGYPQSYLTNVEQMPHSQIPHSSELPHTSQPSMLPFSNSDVVLDSSSCEAPVVMTSPESFQSADLTMFRNDNQYGVVPSNSHISFSTIAGMPSTMLTALPSTTIKDGFNIAEQPNFQLTNDIENGKSFEVIPVTVNSDYNEADTLQKVMPVAPKIRVDSVDSLIDSKGYASDSSSDVYMNSDYTDTITSADSSDYLLPAKNLVDHKMEDVAEVQPCIENSGSVVENFYSNEAFSSAPGKCLSWSSEEKERKKTEVPMMENEGRTSDHWIINIPEEEDSGMVADKEDDEVDCKVAECTPLQVDSTIENLVNHLAEQHPLQMVDISVQVLDGPVYEPLTELVEEEQSWLQSTDSLHLYKLLKQGRSSTQNNVRVRAMNNLVANTMNNLHERSSFLNLTAASVNNLGNACQKALSFVRADMEFGSVMSLGDKMKNSSSLLSGKDQPPNDTEALSPTKKGEATVKSGNHTRNLVCLAILITILLICVNSTRNLQSSLNQEGGVGIICLAFMFASYMFGSLLSPVMVQRLGIKKCIVGGLVFQLLYVAANVYPAMWIMLPASLGGGSSMAVIWNAMSTYIILLARGESDYKMKSYQRVSDKFFGIFCLIYQSNLIIGNLIASLILTFGGGMETQSAVLINGSDFNSTSAEFATGGLSTNITGIITSINGSGFNSTPLAFDAAKDTHYHLCGAEYCHHFIINQESTAVPEQAVYLLFGIFMFLVVIAILMAAFLLEPLSPHLFPSSAKSWCDVKQQLLSMAKFSRSVKFLLMLPLFLYLSMQFSFVCSEVMMAYVTCPVGVWLVGYTMIGYGVCCSLASYITQALVSRTGRGFFIGLVLDKIKVLV